MHAARALGRVFDIDGDRVDIAVDNGIGKTHHDGF